MDIDILHHKTNEPSQESEEDPAGLAHKITELLAPDGDDALKKLELAARALRVCSTESPHTVYAAQHAKELACLGEALGELLTAAKVAQERRLGSVALQENEH